MRRFISFRDFDWLLLGLVLLLSVISIFEIYSATLHTKFVGFETKQIFWLIGGLAAMFIFSLINYHRLLEAVHWVYGFCLVSLVGVLIFGTKVLGGRRWIKLPGGIHFQPSEWVKVVLIVAMARYFSNLAGKDLTWSDIFKAFPDGRLPMLLVLKQPDLGTSLTYIPVLLIGLFLGGLQWKKGLILVVAGLILVVPVWAKVLKPYQKQRLTSFLNPTPIPKGSGYQVKQSLIAVGDGGVWGRGATKGTQTQGDFPAHSLYGLYLCRLLRGAWLRRRRVCTPDILPHIDAFDSKCSDSRRCIRYVPDHGRGRCTHLSDCS
jgi:rod shape determining protein RodA